MPLGNAGLPLATPLDPAEDPPGSLDPLGTLGHAERLADILLPGFTVRMWRARLLTFTTVAAAVADRAVALMDNREDVRLEARLAFERLFVSAAVRMADREPESYANAPRRLPGRDLAKRAFLEGEPLTRANFLKGQAVNGPFGVIARLARQIELVDDDGRLGRKAVELLTAWAEDEELPGILDEDGSSNRAGAEWMEDVVKRTVTLVGKREWPPQYHRIWEQLARHLRPDKIRRRERIILLRLLETDPVRSRMLTILRDHVAVYNQASEEQDRGKQERTVVLRAVRPELGDAAPDQVIGAVIAAIEAYEAASSLLQYAFDSLIWGLKTRGGRARPDVLLGDARLRRHLERPLCGIERVVTQLDKAIDGLRSQTALDQAVIVEPIVRLREDSVAASVSLDALAETILRRHERVQDEKRKGHWIVRESHWTLMPGENRVEASEPPTRQDSYLHPFRIPNAYALLGDLKQVSLENGNGEE